MSGSTSWNARSDPAAGGPRGLHSGRTAPAWPRYRRPPVDHGGGVHRVAEDRVGVELNNGTTIPADLVLLAAGVRPDTTLAVAAGLELGEHGGIAVDTHMQTSDPYIWAAGTRWRPPTPCYPAATSILCRTRQPAGPGGRGEHLRPPDRIPLHPGHLDCEGVRDGGRRDGSDRATTEGRRHRLPRGARPPVRSRGLLPRDCG